MEIVGSRESESGEREVCYELFRWERHFNWRLCLGQRKRDNKDIGDGENKKYSRLLTASEVTRYDSKSSWQSEVIFAL